MTTEIHSFLVRYEEAKAAYSEAVRGGHEARVVDVWRGLVARRALCLAEAVSAAAAEQAPPVRVVDAVAYEVLS